MRLWKEPSNSRKKPSSFQKKPSGCGEAEPQTDVGKAFRILTSILKTRTVEFPTIMNSVICVVMVLSYRCARLQRSGRTSLLLR